MTSDWTFEEKKPAMLTPSDLKQIKDAVRDLRTASPRSALADLVEAKIWAIENGYPASRPGSSADQVRSLAR